MNVRLPFAVVEGVLADEAVAAEDVEVTAKALVVLAVWLRGAWVETAEEGVESPEADVVSDRSLLHVELDELVEKLRCRGTTEAEAAGPRFPAPRYELVAGALDGVGVDQGLCR